MEENNNFEIVRDDPSRTEGSYPRLFEKIILTRCCARSPIIYNGERLCTCRIASLKSISKLLEPLPPPLAATDVVVGEFTEV